MGGGTAGSGRCGRAEGSVRVSRKARQAMEVAAGLDVAHLGGQRVRIDEAGEGHVVKVELTGDRDHVGVEAFFHEGPVGADAQLAAEHHVEGVGRCRAGLVAELHPANLLLLARDLAVPRTQPLGHEPPQVDLGEAQVPAVVGGVLEVDVWQHLRQPLRQDDGAVVLAAILSGHHGAHHAVDEGVEVEEAVGTEQIAGDVFSREHQAGLAGDAHPVGQPARLAPHGLHHEVRAGGDGIGPEVLQLLGHDVHRREVAEGEVDAGVVVVDGLREVHDSHPPRAFGKRVLKGVEEVGGAQRAIATNAYQRVDLEVDQRVVDVAQTGYALAVGEIFGAAHLFARVGATCADKDPSRIAEPTQVTLLEDAIVLIGQQPMGDRVVALEVRVAMEEAQHLAPVGEKRDGRGADDGVGGRGRTAGEHDADALDVAHGASTRDHSPGISSPVPGDHEAAPEPGVGIAAL